jgi:hypothetical protein
MSDNLKPWDCHPDLTEERLEQLAQFFASTRRELMSLYDRHKGDDPWSLGCRGFSWWKNRLMTLANTNEWQWLSIISPTKRFIFGIGDVPVRFYRGRISRPPEGTLASSFDELRQLSLAFPNDSHFRDLKWRFAIETGTLGESTNIIFAGLTQAGEVVSYSNIPFEAELINLKFNAPKAADTVELPAPSVMVPRISQLEGRNGGK